MIEIRNKTTGPISLMVKSFSDRREHAKAMTSLTIPGLATIPFPEERIIDVYLKRAEKWGQLTYRYILNNNAQHEEK